MLKEDGGDEQPCLVVEMRLFFGAFARMERRLWRFKLRVVAVRVGNTTITIA